MINIDSEKRFTETDLQQMIGAREYTKWLSDQVLESRSDGLWFPVDQAAAFNAIPAEIALSHIRDGQALRETIFEHPLRDFNLPVLPFPFTLQQFAAFALHPRFDLRPRWIWVNPDDSEYLDEEAIAAIAAKHSPAIDLFHALFPGWASGRGQALLIAPDPRGGPLSSQGPTDQADERERARMARHSRGEFTLEEAAQSVAEQHGLKVHDLLQRMLVAARDGVLRVVNPATQMARKKGETIREFYDWAMPVSGRRSHLDG